MISGGGGDLPTDAAHGVLLRLLSSQRNTFTLCTYYYYTEEGGGPKKFSVSFELARRVNAQTVPLPIIFILLNKGT